MKQKLSLLAAFVCICGGYKAQAQLVINVYPSQDHTNQTLWIFSGSGTTSFGGTTSIRSSGNHNARDSWSFISNNGNFYNANRPNNQLLTLSPLFSSSNTIDIHSVSNRIPGGVSTNTIFAASATNTPSITIAGRGTRTIARLFMAENASSGNYDGLGIRIQSPNILYGSGEASSWVGAGLINKPIGDFYTGTFERRGVAPHFGQVRVVVNSQVIPEPEEYALIFALFALAFVLLHRRHQQRKWQSTTAS